MKIYTHTAGKWYIQTNPGNWRIDAFVITDDDLSISVTASQEVWEMICQMGEAEFTNFILGCI